MTPTRKVFTALGLAIVLAFTSGAEGCGNKQASEPNALQTGPKIGEGGVINPTPLPVPKQYAPVMITPEFKMPEPGKSLEPHPQIDAEPVPFLNKKQTRKLPRVIKFWVSTNPLGGEVHIDWSVAGYVHSEVFNRPVVWKEQVNAERGDVVSLTVTPVNEFTRGAMDLTCVITVSIQGVGDMYMDDDQVWGRQDPRPCNARGVVP